MEPMRANFPTFLNPDLKSEQTQDFQDQLMSRLIGQDRAVKRMAEIFQVYRSGLNAPHRPLANLLFLGPTGSGKTRLVEATAEVLHGQEDAFIKIDCGEFQHSHEIAKLIGSPPGYVGHRETDPILTQEALDQYHHDQNRLSIVLFDEIEKASDALWRLMLGILDKATLTLGDNRRVDFSKCIVIMTSNLGGREISQQLTSPMGFVSAHQARPAKDKDIATYRTALEAAKERFPPEFMNRIDKVIVFRTLQPEHLEKILDIELAKVQQRVLDSSSARFIFHCSEEARRFLLQEGINPEYGARPLKRTIERYLLSPFANLTATQQIAPGDFLKVDMCPNEERLTFQKIKFGAIAQNSSIPASSSEAACTQQVCFAA